VGCRRSQPDSLTSYNVDLFRREDILMETYYNPGDLNKFGEIGKEAPELARKFFDYYQAVFAEGELSEREKALIALAVAHAVQCPYCIDAYTQSCLEKGSNAAEMTEAVHVATAIRGGASLVHGLQMRNINSKLSL
jgi:alkylhydroperoxidase/carboxymuconolactone decarboxylase family protein